MKPLKITAKVELESEKNISAACPEIKREKDQNLLLYSYYE